MSDEHDNRNGISRREALRYGLAGAAGAAWLLAGGRRLGAEVVAGVPAGAAAAAATRPAPKAKAKAVIEFWLSGGPSHLDTFDPKPDAGEDYTGPLSHPIPTNVDGIRICELLPQLATQADKYSLIRSMTHTDLNHGSADYFMQSGRKSGVGSPYPSIGCVVSAFKGYDHGYKGLVPPYIVLTQPQGYFIPSGFLGPRDAPFVTGGDPKGAKFDVAGLSSPGVTDDAQRQRRKMFHDLDTYGQQAQGDAALAPYLESEEKGYDLMLGDAGKVLDLSGETKATRDSYGKQFTYNTTVGQSALVARRLVEIGVPYVRVFMPGVDTIARWDTHHENFQQMKQLAQHFDQAMTGLLVDLDRRGLLDSTIVWCCGEFGGTPKINSWAAPFNGGRDHWCKCFTALVAGGGFKGGHVVGQSDAKGEEVKDRPVYPGDLLGSIYELMGIDPDGPLPNPMGLPLTVTPNAGEGLPRSKRLYEIM